MTVRPISKLDPELGVFAELLKQPGWALIVIHREGICLHVLKSSFAVPNKKAISTGGGIVAGGVPVGGSIPIAVGSVKVDDHEVDERGDVEQSGDGAVIVVRGKPAIGCREQLSPREIIAGMKVLAIPCIVVPGLAAE